MDGHRIGPAHGEDLVVLPGDLEAVPPGRTQGVREHHRGRERDDGDAGSQQGGDGGAGGQGDQGEHEERRPPPGHGRRSFPPIPMPARLIGAPEPG